jgi:hypothetical protein
VCFITPGRKPRTRVILKTGILGGNYYLYTQVSSRLPWRCKQQTYSKRWYDCRATRRHVPEDKTLHIQTVETSSLTSCFILLRVYEQKQRSPSSSGSDATGCAVFVCWETSVKLFPAVRAFGTSYQLFHLFIPAIVLFAGHVSKTFRNATARAAMRTNP